MWLRDGGQCAFGGRNGRRCRERVFLEFHHADPYAIGGETTAANLSLRCRGHNVHEAERAFGLYVPAVREASVVRRVGAEGGANSPRGELRRPARLDARADGRVRCDPRGTLP